MSFWNTFEKATTKPKDEIIKPGDIVELVDKEADFSVDTHTATRFVGPIFGTNTINVPIIKDGRFFRKPDINMLISIPKHSLGYDYKTKTLDESKCPYLQYVTLDNELLLVATINYVKDSSMKDKDHLLSVLENKGLKYAYWGDKQTKEAIQGSKELSGLLGPIAKRGIKEYYTNVIVYADNRPITETMRNAYTDMTVRSASEQTPISYLDYSATYNLPVYLKDSKSSAASTPVKVLKLTEAGLRGLFEDIVKLNTIVINADTREKEFKGIEDPLYGCEVLVKLEEMSFRTYKGAKTYSYKLAKGERIPLTEAEKKYLLWDLTKLKVEETSEQAHDFLNKLGYCDKVISGKTVTIDTPVVTQPTMTVQQPAVPVPAQPVVVAPIPVASSIPASAVTELPWGNAAVVTPQVTQPTAVEKPVKQMVVAANDDFDSVFES